MVCGVPKSNITARGSIASNITQDDNDTVVGDNQGVKRDRGAIKMFLCHTPRFRGGGG